MLEHKNLLWIIHTTSDVRPTFYVLACCIKHAVDQAEIFCEDALTSDEPGKNEAEDDVIVLSAELADGPLIVDEEDKQLLINPATAGEDAGKKPGQSSSSKAN